MNLLPFALLPGLTAAICAAHDAIQDGVEFLRAHMPAQDRGTVTQERLVREVRLALAAGKQFSDGKGKRAFSRKPEGMRYISRC